jgi:hypothetical protein
MLLPTRSSISATVTQLDTAPHKQSGDAGFKRMLSTVVDTDCWEGARQAAGGHISTLGRQQDAAEGVAASLAASMQRLRGEVEGQQREATAWAARQQDAQVHGCVLAVASGSVAWAGQPP